MHMTQPQAFTTLNFAPVNFGNVHGVFKRTAKSFWTPDHHIHIQFLPK